MTKFKWKTRFSQTALGMVPEDWEVRPIGEIAEFTRGFSYKGSEKFYEPTGYVFVTLNNIIEGGGFKKEYSWIRSNRIKQRHFLKQADLIIANTHFGVGGSGSGRLLGTPALVVFPDGYDKEVGVYSHHITKISPTNPDYKSYLYWYLAATQKQSTTFLTGTTVGGLDIANFERNKLVMIPTQTEQVYIPTILSWFDSLIENKKQQNEVCEQTTMAIFKSWFIDFEPFNDGEFQDSALGKIPDGWDVKGLEKIVEFLYGKGLPENKRVEGPYPVVGSSGTLGYHSKHLVSAPSIVVGRKGNVGSVYLMLEPCFPIDTVFYSSNGTHPDLIFYIYFFLRTASLEDIGLSDTAVPGLSIHTLNSLNILLPPKPILEKFRNVVEPLLKKAFFNQKQISVLAKVRDSLLPLLVFGKLRVEEI